MSAALEALAREKELLLMRSTLCRLRLRLAAQRAGNAPVVRWGRRIAWLASIASGVRSVIRVRAVSNRRPAPGPLSSIPQFKE